jgi:hypothetical protein
MPRIELSANGAARAVEMLADGYTEVVHGLATAGVDGKRRSPLSPSKPST